MKPQMCRTRHDPPTQYGDCLRACIASILDITDPIEVPHFHSDGCDADTAAQRVSDYLVSQNFAPWYTSFSGSVAIDEVLAAMGNYNPLPHYLLFGATVDGDHVVVCQGNKVVHDPNWFRTSLVNAGSSGNWVTMVIARL